MIIKEVVERECCQSKDLKPVLSSPKYANYYSLMFCIYCGARHKYYTYRDAAGSTDHDYEKVKEEWQPK